MPPVGQSIRERLSKSWIGKLRKETTLPIKWIAPRLQMGASKNGKPMLHHWTHAHENPVSSDLRGGELQFQPTVRPLFGSLRVRQERHRERRGFSDWPCRTHRSILFGSFGAGPVDRCSMYHLPGRQTR